jgi:sugar lactone lactonase YvrE
VNESTQRKIWAYDIDQDGNIKNKRLFYSFDNFGMDGMHCDNEGNLYVTRYGKGTVVILSPKGEKLQEVIMKGKNTSNIAFGGLSGQACFVTLQDRGVVERFFAKIPGKEF